MVASPALRAEAPPLPSSFFGSAEVAGVPAAEATEVSAWLGGIWIASTQTFLQGGESSFRLDVPGDREDTPELEGPAEGESFEIRVGGAPAAAATWHAGTYLPLALAAGAGADLRVSLTDDIAVASAGDTLEYSVSVVNDGPGSASSVALFVALAPDTTWLAASGGGAFVAGGVAWPEFDLAEASAAGFTFSLAVASALPAGVDTLATTASVHHDGSAGADPDPSDDQVVDVDTLAAAPDLAVALSDGVAEAVPGATLVARLRVTNQGSQGATGVTAALDLPPALEFYSASHGGHLESGRVVWPALPLPAAATVERAATLRVPADLDATVALLRFEASAFDDAGNGPDLDPTDNVVVDEDAVAHAPDLAVDGVGTGALATDPATLEIVGDAEVAIANRGTLPAGPFGLVLFSDLDGDGDYGAGSDELLGAATLAGLAQRETLTASVTVSGTVRFRGDRLFAKVDPELDLSELDESNNVGDSSRGCGALPAAEAFTPAVELTWPPPGTPVFQPGSVDSLSTPLVVQLTDDNGDGLWDGRDVPDLVFVTTNFYELLEPQIYLRAIRGDTGAALFDVNGFLPHPSAPTAFSFSGLAAGDIDGDGKPELVTTTFGPAPNNTLVALEHDGARKWQSAVYHTHPSPTGLSNRDNPTIADLDGDGHAEIVVGANVFDRFGQLLWRGAGGQAFQSSGNSGDRGGAISAVADVDLDGRLEVVTGNTLYRHDGSIVWQVPLGDGYPAVANFDADRLPEIVVVSQGTVRLHDADGGLIWGPVELPGTDPEAGGAPTIADFDGDGAPEIGVAGSDVYVVLETDGTIRWQASTQDYTSNLTGSTVFDFDGDGRFEVVYRDERRLRIYRGSDGAVLFEDVVSSNTWTEEPVVADVDRDGNAEIVVTSDRAPDVPIPGGERTAGVRVYGDAGDGWTWARPVWNQHAFTPDQIEDDAGIPPRPAWGWLAHNSFRANLAPGGEAAAAPNLTASRVLVDLASLPRLRISARVGNGGRTPVGPGLPVAFYEGDPAGAATLLGVLAVPGRLAPGEFVDLAAEFELPLPATGAVTVVADDDGAGTGRERECDESDNAVTLAYDASSLGLWIAVDDGTTAVAAGDEVVYRIEVSNAFAGEATGVSITDTLPPHATLLDASAGGVENGGVVTWPPVSLASGASTTRWLTLRVDPALPLDVTSWSNQAAVGDDGAQGEDPSPWNNVAVDVDTVTSVTADAGGPYVALEGQTIVLDGSGSFDRDGTIAAFEWELDGDGAFDDGGGATLAFTPPDEGSFAVRLRVRDDAGEVDVDETTVAAGNVAPRVEAPDGLAADEGGTIDLGAVVVTDPGLLDSLSATADWGDGGLEPIAIVAGRLSGGHSWVDDGVYPVTLCASDGDGGEGCASLDATIANVAPTVEQRVGFDFEGWQVHELTEAGSTRWDLSADPATVTQRRNGEPALLVGDLPAFGRYELSIRVADAGDDDYVGIALGVEPAALGTAAADFLLVDWKRADQSGARRGLALSRVHGAPTAAELWNHIDQAANGAANRVEELARGATRGATGWSWNTEYRIRVDHAPDRVRVWVDGALELDRAGVFPSGRLALYDYSQADAIFKAFQSALVLGGTEGFAAGLRATFTDAGVADLHSAEIAWGDGGSEAAPVVEEAGHGEVRAEHVYLDEGERSAELCVTDDEGASGCASIPALIGNAPPVVTLALASSGFRQDPVTLSGTSFTDAGVLDLHAATVDWGDGSVGPATVNESAGAGTLSATHLYGAPGDFVVRVCVDDGDGGIGCQESALGLVDRLLDLAVTKTLSVAEVRPGQRVTYTLQVRNLGTLHGRGVRLTDVLPPDLIFVSASGGGSFAGGVVTWSLNGVSPGASLTRTLVADVAASAPFQSVAVNGANVTDDGTSGPDGVPENNFANAPLRISDDVSPIVRMSPPAPLVEGGALSVSGSWSDTTAGEAHSGSIRWGDSAVGVLALTGSGTGGGLSASHVYVDDGSYPIEACVTDAAGHVGCTARLAVVGNSPPAVVEPGAVDLRTWREEEYESPDPSAEWVVAADGLSVRQAVNSQPSVFFSPLPAFGVFLEGTIQVGSNGDWDDDYIGFVLGYEAGDDFSPDADFLLVDWKQADQDGARRGLAVSRVRGVAAAGDLWGHTGHATEIARAATLGDTGWQDRREYRFRFEHSASRLRLWVDDALELDLAGDFPDGHFGFYNYSQQDVRYRGFSSDLEQRFEGETFELRAPFTDAGVADTHAATIAWDDGAVGPAPARAEQGFGYAEAGHEFLDDGGFQIEACVEDDDGGSDCGAFPLLVLNRPPAVVAGPGGLAVVGEVAEVALARFVDPGRLDSHSATVAWGDGSSGPARVEEDDGAGQVSGAHVWAQSGVHAVETCVADDDGAVACAALEIDVLPAAPRLTASKVATPVDRDGDGQVSPGDDIVYRIEILNQGASPVTAVTLTDPIPAHTRIVPGSLVPSLLAESEDPVVVVLPELAPGASMVVQFAVAIDSPLPAGVREIVNSGVLSSAETAPVPTDDPGQPGPSDPTRVPVVARPALALAKLAELVDLDGDGVATPGEEIEWSLVATVGGATAASGIVVTDPLPAHVALVAGSLVSSEGEVVGLDPLVWVVEQLEVGAAATLRFRTRIDEELPVEVEEIVNQATIASDTTDALGSDDPTTPLPADPTRVPVFVLPTLSALPVAVVEGDSGGTPVRFQLTLDHGARLPVAVDWIAVGGTAVAGEDFLPASGTLTLAPGELSAEITITALGDPIVEAAESFAVALSNAQGVRLAASEIVGTLIDDDTTEIGVSDPHVDEGEAATFVLTLTAPAALPIEVDWTTAGGSATEGADFSPASGRVTFAPLVTAVAIVVATVEDELPELDEAFRVLLATSGVAGLPDPEASATIVDDDPTFLSIEDGAVVEGDAGSTLVALRIRLSRAHSAEVTVVYETRDETALVGEDYLLASGTAVLSPGATQIEIPIVVVGETAIESDESFRVELSAPVHAQLGDPVATIAILDDDAPDCALACPPAIEVTNDAGLCSAPIEYPAPEASGECGVVTCTVASGDLFPVGTTTVSCGAELAEVGCSFDVAVVDVEAPVIAGPELVVGNDAGACAAVVTFQASVTDNCPGPSAACAPPSGSSFPVGVTALVCTATDAAGNGATAPGSVTVEDREPPRISQCPADAFVPVPPGVLSWPFDFETPAATDNCPEFDVGCAPAAGSSLPVGVSTVVCTASDAAGGTSSCAFEVTLTPLEIAEIPALSRAALALLALLTGAAGLALLARRRL